MGGCRNESGGVVVKRHREIEQKVKGGRVGWKMGKDWVKFLHFLS